MLQLHFYSYFLFVIVTSWFCKFVHHVQGKISNFLAQRERFYFLCMTNIATPCAFKKNWQGNETIIDIMHTHSNSLLCAYIFTNLTTFPNEHVFNISVLHLLTHSLYDVNSSAARSFFRFSACHFLKQIFHIWLF